MDGNFAPSLIAYWLFETAGLNITLVGSTQVGNVPLLLPTRIQDLSISSLDALLETLHARYAYAFQGFILNTDEAAGYSHSTTLLKHNGTWHWLDPERPHRCALHATNMQTLQTRGTSLYALLPGTSLDDCVAALHFRPNWEPPPPPTDGDDDVVIETPRIRTMPDTSPPALSSPSTAPPTAMPVNTTPPNKILSEIMPPHTLPTDTRAPCTLTLGSVLPYIVPPATTPPDNVATDTTATDNVTPSTEPAGTQPPHAIPPELVPQYPPPPSHLPYGQTPSARHNTCHKPAGYMPAQTLTLITLNIQNLCRNILDIQSMISEHHPDILFIQETHLYPHHYNTLRAQTKHVLQDYTLYFSSFPSPTNLQGFGPRPMAAPGGVMIAIHRSLTTHPSIVMPPIPVHLQGYCVHVSLPLPNNDILDVISTYWPPGSNTIADAMQGYVQSLATGHAHKRHLLMAGDFNTPLNHTQHALHDFLAGCELTAINATQCSATADSETRTHYPHATTNAPSMLDDFIISGSLPKLTHRNIVDFTCKVLPHSQNTDHAPVYITCPRSMIPILQRTIVTRAIPANTPPKITIIQPIPKPSLETTRNHIYSDMSTDCDQLAQTMETALNSLREAFPHADTASLTRPWTQCREKALSLNVDVNYLAELHANIMHDALRIMHQHCPVRVHKPGRAARPNRQKHFLPRTVQRRITRRLIERKLLTFAKSKIQTWLHPSTGHVPTPPSQPHSGPTMAERLHQTIQQNPGVYQWPSRNGHTQVTQVTPLDLLPTMPNSNHPSEWLLWLRVVHARLTTVRSDITRITKPYRDVARHKRRLSKLLRTAPRKGHQQIFYTPTDTTSTPNMEAVWDTANGVYITEPDAMESYAHSHFQAEWAPDPSSDNEQPYPWLAPASEAPTENSPLDPFMLETPATQSSTALSTLLPYVFRTHTFQHVIAKLRNNKSPGPDGIPNELIRIMPASFKQALRHLFIIMWITGQTPATWKESETILLHKRDNTADLANRRPIGIHSTLYKTWTRFVTTVITDFAEDHSILSPSQEGFRHGHNTARQMQRLVNMIEDAARTHQDLYVLYVDFTNAFNTISHRKLFMIMKDLGFPDDVITVVKGIYTGACTKIHLHKPQGITTNSVDVGRGTIQGDTLSPLIFLIYIEPMLRWFKVGGNGYNPGCQVVRNPRLTQSALAYADDMAMLTGCYKRLIHQFKKLQAYCRWGGLTLNARKCAVSGILHNAAYTGLARSLQEQTNLLRHRLTDKLGDSDNFVPFLPPDKPYKYLGVYITLTLDFKHQLRYLMDATLDKGKQLLAANTPPRQALHIINHVLKPKITYCFPLAPFSKTDIKELDTLLARIARLAMSLPNGFPIKATLCPTDRGGTGLLSLMTDYTQIATMTLTRTLNDTGDLGEITANMLSMQLEEYGRLPLPLRKWTRTFHSHPLPMRLLTIMHEAKLALHRHDSHAKGVIELTGNPLWQTLMACSPPESPLMTRHLYPLWQLGITSFAPLVTMVGGQAYMISSQAIA